MPGIDGYSSSSRLENEAGKLKKEFVTVQPIGSNKHALDTLNYGATSIIDNGVAELGSTDKILKLTAHGARKGDIVRIKTSANNIEEFEVSVFAVVDANTIELAAILSSALSAGDTVDILRPLMLKLEASGAMTLAQGPMQIVKNGVNTEVTKDTATPSNTVPVPVEVVAASGTPINITAGDLNVQLTHLGANADSTRIGNGVNEMDVNGNKEALVHDQDVLLALNDVLSTMGDLALDATVGTLATEATLNAVGLVVSSIDTKMNALATQTTLASVDTKVATQTTLAALEAKFNTLGQKASAASAPVVLSTEQEAILSAIVTAIGVTNTKDFATQTTLAALEAKFNTLGQKASAASAPVVLSTEQEALINTIATKITALEAKDFATQVTLAALAASVEKQLELGPIDLIDGAGILNVSVSNIPASAASPLQIVASIAADCYKIKVIEDVGEFIGLYTGAALSETLLCVLPPGYAGGDLDVYIPAGTRLSIKNMKNATINTATYLAINFLG